MPAGDLVVADFQLELRSLLTGAGTTYELVPPGIEGLGAPSAKTSEVTLDNADGSYGGPEFSGVRVLTVHYVIERDTAAEAMNDLADLSAAWAPAAADIPIYLQLPGWGKFHLLGRPRALDEDLSLMPFGIIGAVGHFSAMQPAIVAG